MRRLLLLTLLTFLLCQVTPARRQTEQTDRAREGLVGPVKTVSAERIDPADDSGSVKEGERRQQLDTITFDERGREVSRIIYDDYGFLVGTETHSFDAAGRLMESSLKAEEQEHESREVYRYDAASRLVEKLTYAGGRADALTETLVYDARGRVTEVAVSYRSEAGGKTKYKYDAGGRLVEVAFYRPNGRPAVAPVGPCFGVHRLAYKYGAQGRPVEVRAFEPDNSLKRTTTYAYDERGNVLEESRQQSYGTLTFKHAYTYDARGNWTELVTRIVRKDSYSPLGLPSGYERVQLQRRTITYY